MTRGPNFGEKLKFGVSVIFLLGSVAVLVVRLNIQPQCDCEAAGCYMVNGSSSDILASWNLLQSRNANMRKVSDEASSYLNKVSADRSCASVQDIQWDKITIGPTASISATGADIDISEAIQVTGSLTVAVSNVTVATMTSDTPLHSSQKCTVVPTSLQSQSINTAIIEVPNAQVSGSLAVRTLQTPPISDAVSMEISSSTVPQSTIPSTTFPEMLTMRPIYPSSLPPLHMGPLMPLDSYVLGQQAKVKAPVVKFSIPVDDPISSVGFLSLKGGYVAAQMLQDEPMMQESAPRQTEILGVSVGLTGCLTGCYYNPMCYMGVD